MERIETELRRAWEASAPLTAAAGLMAVVFAASVAGLFLDTRTIAGAPAWLKPAKFAISTAIFCGTMAWLFRYIQVWPRFIRAMGRVIAAVLVLEVAIIDLQAARGATSHFNVGTPLDGILFSVMGASIAILWLAAAGVLAALCRQTFANSAWGWWLRLAMLITVIGSAMGGMMVPPTPGQLEALKSGNPAPVIGAHTVGAPDGGPGLPGVGWSTQHGDLRIGHFLGLHAIQIVPLIGWLVLRRHNSVRGRPTAMAFAVSGSYLVLIAILAWQALRGQSIVQPDAATLTALSIWAAATAAAAIYLYSGGAARLCCDCVRIDRMSARPIYGASGRCPGR